MSIYGNRNEGVRNTEEVFDTLREHGEVLQDHDEALRHLSERMAEFEIRFGPKPFGEVEQKEKAWSDYDNGYWDGFANGYKNALQDGIRDLHNRLVEDQEESDQALS